MFDSKLPISYYKTISSFQNVCSTSEALKNTNKISIVQHIETRKIYIRKDLDLYNLDIYTQLFYRPIKNTPRIYALYENEAKLTVIEEYISGDTLSELLSICKTVDEENVINYIIQLCDILNDLHTCNPPIIHRDIKPSNLILTEDGRIVLIDFNAAKNHTNQNKINRDTILLGTEDFAAPEQFGFEPSTIRTDIYAIGVLINTLLTGQTGTQVIAKGRLESIIKKCIKLSPKERFANSLQLKKALLRL